MFSHCLYGRVVRSKSQLPAPFATASSAPDITIILLDVPLSSTATPSNSDTITYETGPDGAVIVRCYDRFEFSVTSDGSEVHAYRARDATDESLYAYLLGHALSVAMLKRGVEGLHAAAFEINGSAVAILGDCGHGKSTLAASAIRAGARLLTDDLLIVDSGRVLAGPSTIKLDPEIAEVTLGPRKGAAMFDERGKHIYELAENEFCGTPVALSRIYAILPDAKEVAVERLTEAQAFRVLLTATYNPLEQGAPRLASHMQYHAALAHSVPVFRLHVPRRLSDVANVLQAI